MEPGPIRPGSRSATSGTAVPPRARRSSGATSKTYTLQPADVGAKVLRRHDRLRRGGCGDDTEPADPRGRTALDGCRRRSRRRSRRTASSSPPRRASGTARPGLPSPTSGAAAIATARTARLISNTASTYTAGPADVGFDARGDGLGLQGRFGAPHPLRTRSRRLSSHLATPRGRRSPATRPTGRR